MGVVPIISRFGKNLKEAPKTGDFYLRDKRMIKQNPEIKLEVHNFLSKAMLFLTDPTLIRDFFQKQDYYYKNEVAISLHKLLLGQGLVTSEGALWKKHRKLISTLFQYDFLKSMIPTIVGVTREFLDELAKGDMKRVKIIDEFQKITGEIVGCIFFGKNLNKYTMDGQPLTLALAHLLNAIVEASRNMWRFMVGDRVFMKLPRISALIKKVDRLKAICRNIITERKQLRKEKSTIDQSSNHEDLLELFIKEQEKEGEGGLNDEEIVDEFMSFFVAGMDTTGHLTAMMAYNLHEHPEELEKIKQEVSQVYPFAKPSEITIENTNKLEQMQLVMKETLRYNSPVTGIMLREAVSDHMMGDIRIKKGTVVGIDWGKMSFNPKVYDDAEKFKPERWLKENKNIDAFAFIPFGAGPRNCIGQHLAQIETKIIFSEFLSRFDFKVSEGYKHKMTLRFLYEPEQELIFDLSSRNSSWIN